MSIVEQESGVKAKRKNILFLFSIFCFGLLIFSISQIFKADLILLYKRYVNGNEFEIGGYRYEVSNEFIIFKEENASVFLIYYDSNSLSHITITEFTSNYFDYMVKSKNTTLLDFGDTCKIYKIINQKNRFVNLFWTDEKQKIFLEATIDESLLKNKGICGVVKSK